MRLLVLAIAVALALAACSARAPSPAATNPQTSATSAAPIGPIRAPVGASAHPAAGFTGSAACARCHRDVYDRWRKTPMANVVRDPREDRDAIIPDLATNTIAPFSLADVALVYGSVHKQRYFTKKGDDYFAEPAQWDVTHKVWRKYFVENDTDWWVPFYPADNFQRPTGPLCDGCHSVGYDVADKSFVEWNVGCERCHGPGAAHAAAPAKANVVNPMRLDPGRGNDVCIQCHSQGRPTSIAAAPGKAYDWAVGYQPGASLADVWKLEEHQLGKQSFTHYADGTAHKNRMQGNDFVQSEMYRHGVTCFSCHDVHGTKNAANLREPTNEICADCHTPGGPNGPRAKTLEAHTLHAPTSKASACVACHMPKIEQTIADVKVRAHTFAFIAPSKTEKLGIPNPCNGCHADKTPAWATAVLRRAPASSPWRME